MLPANGWLADANVTGGLPFDGPLPEEFSGLYTEGGDGVVLGATELDFKQSHIIFELSFIRERFGFGKSLVVGAKDYVRILSIELVQDSVFGVLMIDSFTPPAIANEFFEFDYFKQKACILAPTGLDVAFTPSVEGNDVVVVEAVAATPTYSE